MEKKRNYAFDILRIIATIGIVFHHYQQVTNVYFEGGINFWNGKFYFGYVVEFFFLLSGFFMFSYSEKILKGLKFKDYIKPRLIRLLPLVLLSGVVYEFGLYVYKLLYDSDWMGIQITIWGIFIDALGIQEGWTFSNPCVNNVTWYISVLLLCYVVFYLVTYMAKRLQIPVIYLYVAMIFVGCGVQTYGINLPFFNGSSSRGYYAFFAGLLMARLLKNYKINLKEALVSIGIIIGGVYLIVYRNEWMANGINYLMTFIFYPALLVLFLWKPIADVFNHKWIGEIGKITYDVYLWHNVNFCWMYIVIKVLRLEINLCSLKAMLVYTVIQFAIGTLSYYLVEKNITCLLQKRWG